MARSVVVAARNAEYYEQIKDVAEAKGFHTRRAIDGPEVAHLSREHLPNIAVIDIKVDGAIEGLQGVKDVFGLNTLVILCYESNEWREAKEHVDSGLAEYGLALPLSASEFDSIMDESPDEPGFIGDCRATFIDATANREYQTPHGVASRIDSPEFECATVLGDYVPDWVDCQHTEVVLGSNGELVSSFAAESIEREPEERYGMAEQYWFAEEEF